MAQATGHSRVGRSFQPPAFRKTKAVNSAFPSAALQSLFGLAEGLDKPSYFLDTRLLNDIADLDSYFDEVNAQLEVGEYFIGHADHLRGYDFKIFSTQEGLKVGLERMVRFAFHRVMPRIWLTKRLQRWIYGTRARRMSKTEVLGRLVYNGFDIKELDYDSGLMCFKVVKRGEKIQGVDPTFGPLIRLNRMVKGGRMTKIYKLRTMHPYSEFIQDYVYQENDLAEGGKIKDDFRITEEGTLFRKFFLDELPMIINLLKGDIKLVGVRPLSAHYFSLYTEAMRRKRKQHKPGLLPPYYSEEERPGTLEEIMVSEMRYLIKYEKSPLMTDVKYFFKIWYNLILKKTRSK